MSNSNIYHKYIDLMAEIAIQANRAIQHISEAPQKTKASDFLHTDKYFIERIRDLADDVVVMLAGGPNE